MDRMYESLYVHNDFGLGMTYERYAVQIMLQRIAKQHDVRSVLEGPLDGMMGIKGVNSIALAKLGIPVTVILPTPKLVDRAREVWEAEDCLDKVTFVVSQSSVFDFPSGSFDLVWNFAALPLIAMHKKTIADMSRVSRRLALICVNNTANYGFKIHRLHHRKTGIEWCHGDVTVMNLAKISGLLAASNMRVLEELYVDIPFWPDIDTKLNIVVSDLFPILRPLLQGIEYNQDHSFGPENWPYYKPERHPEIYRQLKRLRFIEESHSNWARKLFGHHRCVLAETTVLSRTVTDRSAIYPKASGS